MSNEYKLEKTDIGEMLVIATHALNSNQKRVTLNSDDAVHVIELAYENEAIREALRLKELECQKLAQDKERLTHENGDLRAALKVANSTNRKLIEKHK